jgi:hypothetical protein
VLNVTSGTTTIDNVATPVTGTAGSQTLTAASATGFAGNHLVFIHQTQGTGAGNYELATVSFISGTTISLASPLKNTYSSSGGSNHAQMILVPQYTSVSVTAGATLTAPAWNGTTGGILVFDASGATTVSGTISMTGLGFRGASHANICSNCKDGTSGESTTGIGVLGVGNNGPGGGGGAQGQDCGMGAGGSYGTAGTTGANNTTATCTANPNTGASPAGTVFGAANITSSIAFGGAGGEGGFDEDGSWAGPGGSGGGLIFISSATLTVTGSIQANGSPGGDGVSGAACGGGGCGMGGGGGGAGGAVRLVATTATLGTNLVVAVGAGGGACTCGGEGASGTGGVGRVGINAPSVTGTSNPVFDAN